MTQPDPNAAPADGRAAETLTLGERVRRHRLRQGHSQEEASALIGISRNYLSMIENEHAPNLTANTHRALAVYLGDAPLFYDPLSADERTLVEQVLAARRAGFVAVLIRPHTVNIALATGLHCVVIGAPQERAGMLLEE